MRRRVVPSRAVVVLLSVVFVLTAGRARADEGLAEAILKTQREVAAATAELNALRESAAAQRGPLAARLELLTRDVQEKRIAAERARQWRAQGDRERRALAEAVRAEAAEAEYVYSALLEYRRSLETRRGPAESPSLRAGLQAVDAVLSPDGDYASLGVSASTLLGLAATWNRERLGGESFAGACLDAQGRERDGHFVMIGPLAYFVSADGREAGGVGRRLGSVFPALQTTAVTVDPAALQRVVDGGVEPLPVDASGGDALKLAAARTSWWAHLRAGGPVMVPLAGVGLASLVLVVWKLLALRRVRTPSPADLQPLLARLRAGDVAGAQALTAGLGEPLGEIVRDGLTHLDAPPELLEELLHERVLGVLPRLDRHLGALAVLGGVAPLLGLLGTVTGMIHTFQLVALFGSGDARMLSGGISEALVTTEAGLVIAIPVALVHAYLLRRVRSIIAGLDHTIVAFVNQLKGSTRGA